MMRTTGYAPMIVMALAFCAAVFLISVPMITQAATAAESGTALSCSWVSISCWFTTFAVFISGILISLSGFFLSIAGLAFNFMIDYTIVGFGEFYTTIGPALEAAWGAFRDIANIAIIGAFVFVAISTILGIEQFGIRRFVAQLLIAAVLINFSLFFTKAIIDASNIAASQFANAIPHTSTGSLALESSTITEPDGIAGAFVQSMRLTSVWDTSSALNKIANEHGVASVVIHGVMTSVLFLMVAMVLWYGVFLLFTRAVVLILLLLVSALAFASYAIPRLDSYWGQWWKELIKHAFFAPLLLLFLWATISIAQQVSAQTQGSLANLVTADPLSLAALFNFALTVGLLFLSIHVAKSMSVRGASQIPSWRVVATRGFKYAGAAGAGIRNVARYQSSKNAYKKLEGKPGMQLRADLATLSRKIKSGQASYEDKRKAENTERKLGELQDLAGGKFETLRRDGIIGGALGAAKILKEGAGKGGYADTAKKAGQDEIAQAEKLTQPRRAEKEEAFTKELASAVKGAVQGQQRDHDEAVQGKQAALKRLDTARQQEAGASDSTLKRTASQEREAAERNLREQEERISKTQENLTRARREAAQSPKIRSDALTNANKLVGNRGNKTLENYLQASAGSDYDAATLVSQMRKKSKDKGAMDVIKAAMKEAAGNDNQEGGGGKKEETKKAA